MADSIAEKIKDKLEVLIKAEFSADCQVFTFAKQKIGTFPDAGTFCIEQARKEYLPEDSTSGRYAYQYTFGIIIYIRWVDKDTAANEISKTEENLTNMLHQNKHVTGHWYNSRPVDTDFDIIKTSKIPGVSFLRVAIMTWECEVHVNK